MIIEIGQILLSWSRVRCAWNDTIGYMAAGLAGAVQARYRQADGEFVETTLDRLVVDEIVLGRPVREFRWYKGRRHYSGWYYSSTTGGLVVYESRLELARILLADHEPGVVAICAQPFQIIGRDGDRILRHVPDLLLVSADHGVTVVDVKPPSKVADPETAALFAWAGEVVGRRGWRFEIWSGANPCLLENVRFLAGYRRTAFIATDLVGAVLEAASCQKSLRAFELTLSATHPPHLIRPVVLHLLWLGRLVADLSGPLTSDTPLSLGGQ